jgi:G:T/U-mismatch repair DNA glycosylase/O-acetyl-ADP-ribose deacetylase (regulator of RNase III)
MIKYVEQGDIFDSTADALVNPVNCVGVMGKGLAKQFKDRFPECVPPYEEACARESLVPGRLILVRTLVQPDLFSANRPAVILFPTKKHWRGKSQLKWIEAGLQELKSSYRDWGIRSVAMPQIGCGLGGLNWEDVKRIIVRFFDQEELHVHLYLQSDLSHDVIRDILRDNLDIVFVGTSVGNTSAKKRRYYANKSNSFYRELYSAKFTPRLLSPQEDTQLLDFGIGITDIIKEKSSSDDRKLGQRSLSSGAENLKTKLERYKPKWVCFNGKKAFHAFSGTDCDYGEQERFKGIRIFVVPSTSGRVNGRRLLNGRTRSQWFGRFNQLVRGSE